MQMRCLQGRHSAYMSINRVVRCDEFTNLDDATTTPHTGNASIVQFPTQLRPYIDKSAALDSGSRTSLAVSLISMKPCVYEMILDA